MKQAFLKPAAALVILALCSIAAFGQLTPTGSLTGAVTDPQGAAVAGATVKVKNDATNEELTATTNEQGTFTVPTLPAGSYTVTITPTSGFKQSILTEVRVLSGQPSNVNVQLELGDVTESVTITGAGGELINSTNANVGSTITGRQITDLPFTSRDALDLVLLLPGTQTPGRPRTSTVNGLPKGALNITLDGVNVQDNLLKSSDGFFTYIRPRIDAIEEVSVSTATPGAESSGSGAVQIRFVTESGKNEYHGSLYWYHRNPSLNANFWFNNRDLPPDPVDGTAPRARLLLNQYGAKVGGPISIPGLFSGRDKLFFFVNYEEFRLPESTLRNRTVLNPLTQTGVFQYNAGGVTRTVNLLSLAAANGFPSTIDPTVGTLLGQIRSAVTSGGGSIAQLADPNLQQASFINPGGQDRYFPTVRFDWNINDRHHLENIWNFQAFRSVVDFLNGVDPAFPGFPNFGSQDSNRFSDVMALRSTLTNTVVNEARFGLTGGTVLFFPQVSPAQFENQGGFSLGLGAAGISGATVVLSPQRRNAPVWEFNDNLNWVKGEHNFNFGGSYTRINLFSQFQNPIVPTVGFGVATGDPAAAMFVGANFPGASAAQIAQAAGIYATLTGRVTSVNANARRSEETGNYVYLGDIIQRARQEEYGFYAQDTWRWRPNVTFTFGVREEIQKPFEVLNRNFTVPTQGFNGLAGISGSINNLFVPGASGGTVTSFTELAPGSQVYNTDKWNFAPSVGIAWSPDWKSGLLGRFAGSTGQTVFRAGYSMAFIREGLNTLLSITGSNPGGTIPANRSVTQGNLAFGTLFRNRGDLGPPPIPSAPTFPLVANPLVPVSVNEFDPDLKLGYAQSWTAGIQRELDKDTVVEVRYVGTRGKDLWQQFNLNEVNTVENGFFNEFRLAQQNLQANLAAGRGATFRFAGPGTGTSPLPIIMRHFHGTRDPNVAANYTSTFFANTTFVNTLARNQANPQGFAGLLAFNPSLFAANAAAAGVPRNFFLLNPDTLQGSFLITNTGASWYDGLTVELRRRMAQGLLVQGSYTWSKSQTNMFASSSVVFYQPTTLRNRKLDKTLSPFHIPHAFKVNFIYELPFGRGRQWLGDSGGLLNGLVGGWAVHGAIRTQSGTPMNFQNVQLVGMTAKDLQDAIEIRKTDRVVFWLPDDIIENTIRAFNTSPTSATGFSARGVPTGRFLAPVGFGGCTQPFGGQCGFSNLVVRGPRFNRVDVSVVKKVRFTENTNFELRGEFLNLPNSINFRIGSPAADAVLFGGLGGSTFGQTNSAYQDLSTTNDPGGRMVQFVLRFNF